MGVPIPFQYQPHALVHTRTHAQRDRTSSLSATDGIDHLLDRGVSLLAPTDPALSRVPVISPNELAVAEPLPVTGHRLSPPPPSAYLDDSRANGSPSLFF